MPGDQKSAIELAYILPSKEDQGNKQFLVSACGLAINPKYTIICPNELPFDG
jgi:hypothetical protein